MTEFATSRLICPDQSYDTNITLPDSSNITEDWCEEKNLAICKYAFNKDEFGQKETICTAEIDGQYDQVFTEGSHSLTFWLYFLLRVLFRLNQSSAWTIGWTDLILAKP